MATVLGSKTTGLKESIPRRLHCQPSPKLGQTFKQHSRNRLLYRGTCLNAADTAADGLCRVIRVTYLRPDGKAAGWGLHVWGAGAVSETAWDVPMAATGYVNLLTQSVPYLMSVYKVFVWRITEQNCSTPLPLALCRICLCTVARPGEHIELRTKFNALDTDR